MLNPISTLGQARRCAIAAAAAAAIGAAMLAPSQAAATGTFINLSCAPGTTDFDSYGGWKGVTLVEATGVTTSNGCDSGGSLHAQVNPGAGYTVPVGKGARWVFDAPADTRITGLRASLSGWVDAWDGSNRGIIEIRGSSTGRITLLDSNSNATIYPTPWSLTATALNDATVSASVLCDGPTGYPDCPGGSATGWLALRSIKTSLADDAPPAAGTVGGTATTDMTWKAAKQLAYAATDQGGGIAAFRLYVDGVKTVDHVVDGFAGRCAIVETDAGDWVFPAPKPCPGAVDDTEVLDTTTIADGHHTITAKVVDVGQREATLFTGTRLVANHPPVNNVAPGYTAVANAGAPVTGVALGATDGSWSGPSLSYARAWQQCDASGTGCVQIPGATTPSYTPTAGDVGHRLRYAITATNVADSVTAYSPPTGLVSTPSSSEAPTPKPSNGSNGSNGSETIVVPGLQTTNITKVEHVLIGRVAGERPGVACPQDKATLVFEHVTGGQTKLSFGKSGTAQVQLTCTNTGKAIADAKLEIMTKTGDRPVVAADVTTDGAGHAILRLGKGASRGITVGYRMYADDAVARATATLKVSVAGKIDIKANRTRLRNGGVVRLTGVLRGGLVPSRGVNLTVQWQDGAKWRPFAQIRSNRSGRFRYAYKFTRTPRKVVYRLRVRMASGQIDYPYAVASSKTVRVTVAP